MTVLVTGGAGYIGSHMVWQLLDKGENVVVLDRLSTGFDWAVPMDAKLIIGDVGDRPLVEQIIKDHNISAVIHFAALTVVPDSFADPTGYYENNTAKALNLIGAAAKLGVKHFIFSSTAAVYGVTGNKPATELDPTEPVSPYGMSKLMTERILADACTASGMTYTVLRYFNVAGSDPQGRTGQSTPEATHLIKVACEAAAGTRPELEVYGTDYDTRDGTAIRDFIHVSDLVDLHYRALSRLRNGGESMTANCGYGTGTTILEVIGAIERVTGKTLPVHYCPRRHGDVIVSIADSSRIREALDWEPTYGSIDDIVATSIAWEESLKRRNTPRKTLTNPPDIEQPNYDEWDIGQLRPVRA